LTMFLQTADNSACSGPRQQRKATPAASRLFPQAMPGRKFHAYETLAP
jgi:hypothetical protein